MTLVSVIITGVSERLGMAIFLKKLFPQVEFVPFQVDSFTSSRVTPFDPTDATTTPLIDKFARAIIASVDPGRKKPDGPVPDYVLAIDDLELWNLDQPDLVVTELSFAIRRAIHATFSSAARQDVCAQRLMDYASFHLLCPMLEAYFFADQNAILKATANSLFELVPGSDLEDFETCDAVYLMKHINCPRGVRPGPILPQSLDWFAKHPKHYVKHLSADPQTGLVKYRESQHGTSALTELSPNQALAVTTQRRFLRSMVHDLADALNIQVPVAFQGDCHPVTSRHTQVNRVLRNI